MKFKIGDNVKSTICPIMFGNIKEYVNEQNFILKILDKEIYCHEDYYVLKKF